MRSSGRAYRGMTLATVATFLLAGYPLLDAAWARGSTVPDCVVSPHAGVPSAGVVFSGSRWKPRSTVTISFVQQGVTVPLGADSVNRNGHFSGSTSVPQTARPSDPASFSISGKGKDGRTHSCSAAFTVTSPPPPPAPIVSSFNPTSGPVETPVTIGGSGFTGATDVTFGGVSAGGNFTVSDDSQVVATVPSGAMTGQICVATALSQGCSSSSYTVTHPPLTAAWGADAYSASSGSIRTMETDMGRSFAAWAAYRRIDDAATYPATIAGPISRGAILYLNINNYEIDPTTGVKIPACWSNVSNGNEDAMIDAWAQAIIDSGYMDGTVITFEHEPNVNSSIQPKCSTDDGAAYRAAFDHFHARMRADGVTSRFAFVPTARLYATPTISSYLPPAGDFQLIGADVYNMSADPTSTKYRTVSEAFGPFYAWADANEPGMPLIIGELGENQNDLNAPQWISDALDYMKSNGNLLFVNWNLEDSGTTYFAPLVRSDSLEAWLLGAADPYFAG